MGKNNVYDKFTIKTGKKMVIQEFLYTNNLNLKADLGVEFTA